MILRNLISGLMLGTALHMVAADNNCISGSLKDNDGNPVELAVIALFNRSDSTFIDGTVSDADGHFIINSQGDSLTVNCLGYEPFSLIDPVGDIGQIVLSPADNVIGEIEVKSSRQIVRQISDGIKVDVTGTYLAETPTALGLIGKMPFVVVSDQKIEVIGKGTPLIYINGREMRDENELEQLSPDRIKSIEIVTSPGARYKSTVNAVIRITTLAPVGEGFSFANRTRVGWKHYAYIFQQDNLNYRHDGLDLFATLNFEDYRQRLGYRDDAVEYLPVGNISTIGSGNGISKYPVYDIKTGFNYIMSPNHTVGLIYDFAYRPSDTDLRGISERSINGDPDDRLSSISNSNNINRRHLISTYYSGKISNWEISANADMMWQTKRNVSCENEWSELSEDRHFVTRSLADNRLLAANVSATKQISSVDLTAGADLTDISHRNTYRSDALFIESSDHRIKETNLAVFGEATVASGAWRASAGLRYEFTDSRFYDNGVRQPEQSRHYNELTPSAMLSYSSDKFSLRLNYSGKISRPTFDQLSSSIRYQDRYTYESGNPHLRPIKRDYISLSGTWLDLSVECGYRSTKNYFMWQSCPISEGSQIILTRMENMPRFNSWWALAFWAPTIDKWHPSVMTAIEQADFSIIHNNTHMKLNKPIGIFRLDNSVRLPLDFMISLALNYTTAGNSENIYSKSSWRADASISKTFGNGSWNVILQLDDIFGSSSFDLTWFDSLSRVNSEKLLDTRDLHLTVRYNFNPSRDRYRGDGAGNDAKERL